jgi:hypothetical protein
MTRRTRSFLIDNNTGAILINTGAISSTDPVTLLEPSNFFQLIDDKDPKLGGNLDSQQKNISNAQTISANFFVGDGSSLTGITVSENIFYFVRAGETTGPVTGTKFFTPTSNISLSSLSATVNSAASGNFIFSIMKNNVVLQQFSITSGQASSNAVFTSNNITPQDTLSLNVDSGNATNLVVKIQYL